MALQNNLIPTVVSADLDGKLPTWKELTDKLKEVKKDEEKKKAAAKAMKRKQGKRPQGPYAKVQALSLSRLRICDMNSQTKFRCQRSTWLHYTID